MTIRLLVGMMIGGGIGALMGYFGKCTSGMCPLTANPLRGAIVGSVFGMLFALSYGGTRGESTGEKSQPTKAAAGKSVEGKVEFPSKQEALIHVNNEMDFKHYVLEAEIPCLVDFFSLQCPPCRVVGPIVEKLAGEYEGRAVVCKVSLDVAENQKLAEQYRIMAIPTVIFFSKGKPTKQFVGLRHEGEYAAILDRMIKGEANPGEKE